MSQISPPIRILFIAVVGLCAAYMLFFRPKPADTAAPAAAPAAATTPVPGEPVRGSKAAAILEKAAGDKQAAGAHNTQPVSPAPATRRAPLPALPAHAPRAVPPPTRPARHLRPAGRTSRRSRPTSAAPSRTAR